MPPFLCPCCRSTPLTYLGNCMKRGQCCMLPANRSRCKAPGWIRAWLGLMFYCAPFVFHSELYLILFQFGPYLRHSQPTSQSAHKLRGSSVFVTHTLGPSLNSHTWKKKLSKSRLLSWIQESTSTYVTNFVIKTIFTNFVLFSYWCCCWG